MTISQWPNRISVMPFDTEAVSPVGMFILPESIDLKHVLSHYFRIGALGGSETASVGIYPTAALISPLATSSAVALSSVPASGATNSIFWMRHDFSTKIPLTAGQPYYLGISLANYTRNADLFYIAAMMDNMTPFNVPANGPANPGAKFRIIGER